MRTEDDLRRSLADAAQRATTGSANARARIGKRVRRQRAWRLGAVAGVVVALAAFGIVSITRPDHPASVRVVSPGPSPSPSAAPGPEPDTGSTPGTSSSSDAVPAGFAATSITFVSPKDGFVLGSAPCAAAQPCTIILRTDDTGKTWHRIGAPAAQVSQPGSGDADIYEIRFATVNDGWVFGPKLWATHDGGSHWSAIAHNGDVKDLEAAAGVAHMVVLSPPAGPDSQFAYRILSSPVSEDVWAASPTTIIKGAAPIADAEIVLQHRSGWLLINERTVYDGARLTPTGWVKWKPPCADAMGPATLVAPTSTVLFAICSEGVWGQPPPPGTGLYVSRDGGATFDRAKVSPPGNGSPPASPDPSTVVVAAGTPDGKPALFATFDGGSTWSVVYHGSVEQLGFTSPTQGIGLEASGAGTDGYAHLTRFVLSTDGGHHWRSSPFRPSKVPTRRCNTGDLKLSVGEQVSEATQQRSLALELTNTSKSQCHLFGYPGITVVSEDSAPLGVGYQRGKDQMVTGDPPGTVELARGATAVVLLNQDGCAGQHYGQRGVRIQLIPPDEHSALTVQIPSDRRLLGECGVGDPGNVVHISPVVHTLGEALAQS